MEIGVGYADPEIASQGLMPRSDALTFLIVSLKELWMTSPEYLMKCDVSAKPDASRNSRVASDVVTQDILIEFENLPAHYQPERQ